MNILLSALRWLVKLAIFFTLFAFALNNQQAVVLHFFFGHAWQTPLVLVVLATFAVGVVVGVLGMMPWWWRHRSNHAALPTAASPATPAAATTPPLTQAPYADGI